MHCSTGQVHQVYVEEVERLVGAYNQGGEHGEVYALDGKALSGMSKREDGTSEYVLSVYDVKTGKTLPQVHVGQKENEITKAPEAIQLAKIAGKVVTGDALHTQKRLSQTILEEHFRSRKTNRNCIKISKPCSPQNIPNPALAKSKLIS